MAYGGLENTMDIISPLNRRIAPRYTNVFPIGVRERGTGGRSINISSTGLRMVCDQPLPEGGRVHLTLSLEDGYQVEVQGHAVWQQCLGNLGTHVVGVEFAPDQQQAQDDISRWLRSRGQAA